MPFAILLAVDLIAREPAPLVLAWWGRVVPGLSAPLLVDNGKPGWPVVASTGGQSTWPWTSPRPPTVARSSLTRSRVNLDHQRPRGFSLSLSLTLYIYLNVNPTNHFVGLREDHFLSQVNSLFFRSFLCLTMGD